MTEEDEAYLSHLMSLFNFSREEATDVLEGRMIPDATTDARVAAAVFNLPLDEAQRRIDEKLSFVMRDKVIMKR